MLADLRAFAIAYGTWLVLAPFRLDFLMVGLGAALIAVLALRLAGLGHVPSSEAVLARPGAVLAYLPGALWRALKGGIDVAGRVLQPGLPIRPRFISFAKDGALDRPLARAVFSGVVSLMPGTLAAGRDGHGHLRVHLLVADEAAEAGLIEEHQRIDAVMPAGRPSARGQA